MSNRLRAMALALLVASVTCTAVLYSTLVWAGDESISQSTNNWTQTGVAGAVGVALLGLIRKLSSLADDGKSFIRRAMEHFTAEEAVLIRVDKTIEEAAQDRMRAAIREEIRRENTGPIAVGEHR